ncbi:MAG: hypothetical protein EOP45_02055 [Sphingobacteriaceae bacterium]|nr:MAG: hypothetical protein EOP45_02055 [Sphingobacteriaceae bacterium]
MKKIKLYIIALLVVSLSSCIKENLVTFNDSVFEWDASAYNANAAGQVYPILTRVPGYNRTTVTSDPAITRTSGTIKFRVNLVGAQRSIPTVLTYRVVVLTANTTTPSIQPAIQGTHFNTSGTVTVPANSSFGEVEVQILNSGVSSTIARDVVLEIVSTADVKPSENDKFLGFRISQI